MAVSTLLSEHRTRMGYQAISILVLAQLASAAYLAWRLRSALAALPFLAAGQPLHSVLPSLWWISRMEDAAALLLLLTLGSMLLLEKAARKRIEERRLTEVQLSREQCSLEQRVHERTSDLHAEVRRRMLVENLNQGRNQILEMLARDERTDAILQVLVDILARHRSSWGCALHLERDGVLELAASSDLPERLARSLGSLREDYGDAPERAALLSKNTIIVESLLAQRRPWTELLFANHIRSVVSMPIMGPEENAVGTLTLYTRLRFAPPPADLELLTSHTRMASMVLERSRLQSELRRHAYHDSLTGLPNRLLGQDRLAESMRRAQRTRQKFAVLWIDLNKFKQVNDVYGHPAGDAVLREAARRLSVRVGNTDTVARMGGDEFMVILEDTGDAAAPRRLAEQLVQALEAPIQFEQLALAISASIGIAVYPDDGTTISALERNADVAMYEAKFGRHGIRTFSPALGQALTERRELETELKRAIENNWLHLHYQPQCTPAGRVVSLEALLRFTHPTLGSLPPSRFIPVAEESDLIISLGAWALREACRQARQWQQDGLPPLRIAVNSSAIQFARKDFAEVVAGILAETGLAPSALELEVTETVMVRDFAESIRQMNRLKEIGISIAIDDFGTGYSSLSYLRRLPIDRLKIDRSFVRSMEEQEAGTLPIVQAIISMAQSMGLAVAAEGIEEPQQVHVLAGRGCDLLQGYLFSRPVEAGLVPALVRADSLWPADKLPARAPLPPGLPGLRAGRQAAYPGPGAAAQAANRSASAYAPGL